MWDKWPRTFKSRRLTTIGNLPCNSIGLIFVLNFCSYYLLQSFNCHQFDSKVLSPSGMVRHFIIKKFTKFWCCYKNYYHERKILLFDFNNVMLLCLLL